MGEVKGEKEHLRTWVSQGISFVFFNLLAMPHGMWDLGSPTRDRTHASCSRSTGS